MEKDKNTNSLLDLKDVRDYLLETNAINEAEEILLKNIIDKSDKHSKKSFNHPSVLQPKSKGSSSSNNNVDVIRISELLQECENVIDTRNGSSLKKSDKVSQYLSNQRDIENQRILQPPVINDVHQLLSSDLKNYPEIDLDELEKLANEEIFRLESSKLSIQRKLEDQKLIAEKEKNQNKPSSYQTSKYPPMFDIDTTLQLQQKLIEESNAFIEKSSKQKAELLSSKRDLDLFKNNSNNTANASSILFSKDSSYLQALKQPMTFDSSSLESNIIYSEADLMKQSRIQNILSNIQDDNYLIEKRKEIEFLRNVESEKQRYESITLHPPTIEKSIPLPSKVSQHKKNQKSLITSDGSIDRSITANDFLDQWLQEEMIIQSPSASFPNANQPSVSTSSVGKNTTNNINNDNNGGKMKDVFDNMNVFQQNNRNSSNESDKPSFLVNDLRKDVNRNYNERERTEAPPEEHYYNQKYSADLNYRHDPTTKGNQPHPYNSPYNLNQNPQAAYQPASHPQMNPSIYHSPQQIPPQFNPGAAQMQHLVSQLEQENRLLYQQMAMGNNPAAVPGGEFGGGMDPMFGGNPIGNMMNPGNPFANGLFGGGINNNPLFAGPGGGGGPFGAAGQPPFNPLMNDANNANSNNLYPLKRDNPVVNFQRKELQKQDEIRSIQYEIEKLKYEKQLNEMKSTYEKEKMISQRELEYELAIENHKKELQMIKMQQIITKEKKLLELQQGNVGNNNNFGNFGGAGGGREGGGDNEIQSLNELLMYNTYREECGVGVTAIPFELSKGISVLVDGVILPKSYCEGNYYRIALGIYDNKGKSLIRLIATQWLHWKTQPVIELSSLNNKASVAAPPSRSAGSASGGQRAGKSNENNIEIEILQAIIFQTLKTSDLPTSLTIEYLTSLKCLIELQIKETDTSPQQSIGYAVLPLFSSPLSPSQDINSLGVPPSSRQQQQKPPSRLNTAGREKEKEGNKDLSSVTLANNCWKAYLRKGISDPLSDPNFPPANPSIDLVAGNNAFFLIRLIDTNEFLRASNWKMLIQGVLTNEDILKLYLDPYSPFSKNNLSKSDSKLSINTSVSNGLDSLGSRPGTESMKSLRNIGNNPLVSQLPPSSSSRPQSKLNTPNFQPSMKGKAPSMANLLEPLEEVDDSMNDSEKGGGNRPLPMTKQRKISSDDYWLLGNPLGPCTEKYQRGDGVDIYIDTGRFLPDNVTVSRLSLRFFTSNKQPLGNSKSYSNLSSLSSPAMHPLYNLKAELRGNTINSSIIGLIRIDTIDSVSLLPVVVGYSVFKIFATRDRKSIIPNSNDNNIYINNGSFQLPLYAGKINADLESFDENLMTNCQCVKIPCASILVRIFSAPKSSDGLTTLSRDEFPKDEWLKLKLDYPIPDYSKGIYSGALCEPSNNELLAFEAKSSSSSTSTSSNLSSEVALSQAVNANPTNSLVLQLPSSSSPLEEYESLFPSLDSMRGTLDYNYTVPYHIDSGICVNIHSLFNMPDYSIEISAEGNAKNSGGGGFGGLLVGKSKDAGGSSNKIAFLHKVISSLSPPALYYQDPPLSDHVYWTKTADFTKHLRNPTFRDDNYCFYPAEMSFNLYLILDVRTVRISTSVDPSKEKEKKNSNASAPSADGDDGKKMKLHLEPDPNLLDSSNLGGGGAATKKGSKQSQPQNCKNYWTLLPISCEKYKGNGYRYIASGFYQLPLMEGSFPSSSNIGGNPNHSILKAFNLYEEMLGRLSINNTTSPFTLNNFIKLSSDGSSILLSCYNPLLNDFYNFNNKFAEIFKYQKTKPNDYYIQKIFNYLQSKGASNSPRAKDFDEEITSVSQLISGGNKKKTKTINPNFSLIPELFQYSSDKYTSSTSGKSLNSIIPFSMTQIQFMKEMNEFFVAATGLHDY
jgi:hypothetical protein